MRGRVEESHGGAADESPASRGLGGVDRGVVAADRDAPGGNASAGTLPPRRGELGGKSPEIGESRREAEKRDGVVGGRVPPGEPLGGNPPIACEGVQVWTAPAAVRDRDPEPPALRRRGSGLLREAAEPPYEPLPFGDPRLEQNEERRRAGDRVEETPWRRSHEPAREIDRGSVRFLFRGFGKLHEEGGFRNVAGLELHETRGETRRRRHRKYTGTPVATSAYPGHVVLGLPATRTAIRITPAAA